MPVFRKLLLPLVLVGVASCASSREAASDVPVIVTTSSITYDLVNSIVGDYADVVSIVPNATDTHTYEPKASELRYINQADLVVFADKDLNPALHQAAKLTVGPDVLLDLNASSLTVEDYVYRDPVASVGRNVHTWTDPTLTSRWLTPLYERLSELIPEKSAQMLERTVVLERKLRDLDNQIEASLASIPVNARKLVVYHDAWQYFGLRYGFTIVGALQAVDFSEPSPREIAAMSAQIRQEGVKVFFGSEVFSSDVMEVLESESGARYVPDLADDRLPGELGSAEHTYIEMMLRNVNTIAKNLAG